MPQVLPSRKMEVRQRWIIEPPMKIMSRALSILPEKWVTERLEDSLLLRLLLLLPSSNT